MFDKTLYLDFETFNEIDISDVGTYAYCEHKSLEPLLLTWALGPEMPVQCIDFTQLPIVSRDPLVFEESPALEAFFEAVQEADEIVAHHAMFDRRVALALFPDWDSEFRIERWRCSMTKALLHGFPAGLDYLCRIFKLGPEFAKHKGKALINRFCKPAPSNHKADRYSYETHPDEWDEFIAYAIQDTRAMRRIDYLLPNWNDETELWHLDQKINDRGFAVDTELVEAGAAESIREGARLAKQFIDLTNGEVEKPTQRERFKQYMREEFGIDLPNTQGGTIAGLLDAGVEDARARKLLGLVLIGNKTSTAKYGKLGPATNSDGRFRGGLMFSGAAASRRWSGRTFQPHNLPSRGLPPQWATDRFIEVLKAGIVDLCYTNTNELASAALRGCVIAPNGRNLACADLSNIEGRIAAWYAQEEWKLKAFAEFDAGNGPDLYNVTAGSILGQDPYDVSKENRNAFGKVPELALGYGGGVGAFQTFAAGYRINMADYWDVIRENLPQTVEAANAAYEKRGTDYERDGWVASECVKIAWRDRHPMVAETRQYDFGEPVLFSGGLWTQCEDAAREAIRNPGRVYNAGKFLKYIYCSFRGTNYLRCRLASGAELIYCNPKIGGDGRITYWSQDHITHQWVETDTYGGKLFANACQSTARDVLAYAMPILEAEGFELILSVHDENLAETDGPRSDRMAEIMATNPPWLPGCPLAAAGFDAPRYKK